MIIKVNLKGSENFSIFMWSTSICEISLKMNQYIKKQFLNIKKLIFFKGMH